MVVRIFIRGETDKGVRSLPKIYESPIHESPYPDLVPLKLRGKPREKYFKRDMNPCTWYGIVLILESRDKYFYVLYWITCSTQKTKNKTTPRTSFI